MGGSKALTINEIYAALTTSDSRSDWASEFAAATCVPNVSVYLLEKVCFSGQKSVL